LKTNTVKPSLLGLKLSDVELWMVENGEPRFRSKQVFQWVHQRGVIDFSEMHTLSIALRHKLAIAFSLKLPTILNELRSKDGTVKWLLTCEGGGTVETVYIPEENRGTLCISSQIGCGFNCSFCATGKQGFTRNLTTSEIISQLWLARYRLDLIADERGACSKITNVVFMGMGEPLLNEKAVFPALDILLHDLAYGLSKYRVTVSTSGVIPAMNRLREHSPVALAVSLHAASDSLRDVLVPVNKKFPLSELKVVCIDYFKGTKRKVTIEYVMLNGINDQLSHAKDLYKWVRNMPVKINLIPFNSFSGTSYQCSPPEVIEEFRIFLQQKGIVTTVRKSRGRDIDSACGQLAGQGMIQDRTYRTEKGRLWHKQKVIAEQ
jgi:23S rRNA (adenine2503-C2)-methyltransferase